MNSTNQEPKPIMESVLYPFKMFAKVEAAGGILLMVCAVAAMVWANSAWSGGYHGLWNTPLSVSIGSFILSKRLELWINDGLMAIFFFMVGLEIKREIMVGALRSFKLAVLPISAAIGGMVVPALIYYLLNPGGPGAAGWGIPMATDIAFALGILSLLGNRVPLSLKIFLTAVAIVDDIGAVLVIAVFYTSQIYTGYLLVGAGFLGLMILLNYAGCRHSTPYVVLALALWFCFLKSGVHATIAGVLAAMTIPAKPRIRPFHFAETARNLVARFENAFDPGDEILAKGEEIHTLEKLERISGQAGTPLQRIEHGLHPWVAFAIMPVFALANAGVTITGEIFQVLSGPASLGIITGLVIGKQAGVFLGGWLMVRLKIAPMPPGLKTAHIYGAGWLAGIGFTMSMFIANLAFPASDQLIEQAKVGILAASVIAGLGGYLILKSVKPVQNP